MIPRMKNLPELHEIMGIKRPVSRDQSPEEMKSVFAAMRARAKER